MGELILCNHAMASLPFYIDALSTNIYSLEELCYLIEHNVFLLEEDFFEQELFLWIEREVGARELAEKLREADDKEAGMPKYIELLYEETGYWNASETTSLMRQIEGLRHKSILERRKLRADRYIENGKYAQGILEYRRILKMDKECKENPLMCANIWHNQGVAQARMFLFEEAKDCFLTAYKYQQNPAFIQAALMACRYQDKEEEALELAQRYGMEEVYRAVCEAYDKLNEKPWMQEFEGQIEELFAKECDTPGAEQKVTELLDGWKKEYQKNRS